MSVPRHAAVLPQMDVHEHVLGNGLRAIVHPRPGSPVVSSQIWYRVGSREETKGRTGLAHFLEHLLFKGTDTLRKGDIDLVTLRNGGHNNADTTTDRTRYYFTFAKDRWERALEIEADRMRGSAFDEFEFQAERGPVLEELRADHDDPWWRLHESLAATAYQVHPYRNPVIGWPEEVIRVPREDVLAFYDAWYRPNNATLVVAGDVEPDQAFARIEQLFGAIEAAALPEHFVPAEPAQQGERRFELELAVNVPRLAASFHTVEAAHADDVVLDFVQMLLTGGKASRLYRRLVREESLVTEVSSWSDTRRDPGVFQLFAELREGADDAALERALWEELDRLATDGPADDELERARRQLQASSVYRRSRASGMADMLGTFQTLAGDWRKLAEQDERLATVGADHVRDVAGRYLVRRNRTVGWVRPRPADAPPPPGLPGDDVHLLGEAPADDRDAPAILARTPSRRLSVELPAELLRLGNGLEVVLLPRHDLPLVAASLSVESGRLREARPGIASLTGQCLDEGAAGLSGQELSERIEQLGATLNAGSNGAALRCLRDDLPTCLALMADIVRRPDFPDASVERKRNEALSTLLAERDDANRVARRRIQQEIYGDHPYGRHPFGSEDDLRAFAREDLVHHHRTHFRPDGTILGLVGDLDRDAALELVERAFGDWEAGAEPTPTHPAPPEPEARTIELPDDKEQAHVYLGHLGIRFDDPDRAALVLADHVLGTGPGFTDRLSRHVRDELGLAYTVWGRIGTSAAREERGTFLAYVGTSQEQRAAATAALRREIRQFVEGPIGEQELEDARQYLLGSYAFTFETAAGTVAQLVSLRRMGLPLDHVETFVREIETTTLDQVHAAVRRHIHPDRLIEVATVRR